MGRKGREQDQRRSAHSARDSESQVRQRGSIPFESERGEGHPSINSQHGPVRRQGRQELAQSNAEKIAAKPEERGRRDARRQDVKNDVEADAEKNGGCW